MFSKGLIISVQLSRIGFPRHGMEGEFVREIEVDGVVGVRLNGPDSVARARGGTELPIIGIDKREVDGKIVITPTVDLAENLREAGANYVATDGTGRRGWDSIAMMVRQDIEVIADISTVAEAVRCMSLGCHAVTTALSGYTEETMISDPYALPDLNLVRRCADRDIPVIAEGRYWTPEQVREAFTAGAVAVCVGAAVTMPRMIVNYLKRGVPCT
jgi:putative N-acetylmannosamine-6-phosphate epimerase